MPTPPDPQKLAAALAFVRGYLPECTVDHLPDADDLTVRVTFRTFDGAVRVPWKDLDTVPAAGVADVIRGPVRKLMARIPGIGCKEYGGPTPAVHAKKRGHERRRRKA